MKRTEQPVSPEPYDHERVASGDVFVLVELPNGRRVYGKVADRESMYVPKGPPVPVSPTRDATMRRRTRRDSAVMIVGGLTTLGRTDPEIIAALAESGLLIDGEPDDANRLRTVKKWRAEYVRKFGPIVRVATGH